MLTEVLPALGLGLEQERRAALFEVERFLTRVWMHPLLDSVTVEKRRAGLAAIAQEMQELAVEDYAAVMVGGALWKTTTESDVDFVVFVKDATKPPLVMISRLDYIESLKVDTLACRTALRVWQPGQRRFVGYDVGQYGGDILLTPDEFIAGDLEFARELRLGMMEYLRSVGGKGKWQRYIEDWFDTNYRRWSEETVPRREGSGRQIKGADASRQGRYNRALEARSKQSGNPEKWQAAFEKAKQDLKVPGFETYASAIWANGGELTLRPQYVSQGI